MVRTMSKEHVTMKISLEKTYFDRLKRMYPQRGQVARLLHALLLEHALTNSIQRDPEIFDTIAEKAEAEGLNPLTFIEIEAKKYLLGFVGGSQYTKPERIVEKRKEIASQLTPQQRRLLKRATV